MIAFTELGRLRAPAPVVAARCELCGVAIGEPHAHVVEIGVRGVQCVCRPCGVLFTRDDSRAAYRTVPDRVRIDAPPAIDVAGWQALGIPVGLAFVQRSRDRVVIGFPGPAGIADAELSPEQWASIGRATPLADELADDVEALLVHATHSNLAIRIVPITAAYDLAARVRRAWRGFTGGDEVERELASFFAEIDRGAR